MGRISECLYEILPEEVYSTEHYGSGDFRRNLANEMDSVSQESVARFERDRVLLWKQLANSVLQKHPEFDQAGIKTLNVGVMTKNKVAVVLSK